jgi:hypothetical protein
MKDTIDNVLSESRQSIANLSTASEEEAGLYILQLFIRDLLGRDTAAAKVFAVKAEEDYVTQPVVSMPKKIVATVLLVLVNAFCIYYSILRGYRKGLAWQRSFMMACILQFLIEVFYSETLLCLYVHCFVPSTVSHTEIKRVQSILHHCIHSMCKDFFDPTDHSESDRQLLNAADYFFVSTHVAKAYPDLMESMIVLAYKSFMPGAIAHKWKRHDAIADASHGHEEINHAPVGEEIKLIASTHNSFAQRVLLSIAIFFTVLETMLVTSVPLSVQKMIVRFLEPFLWGGLSYTWLLISNSTVGVSLFVIAVAAMIFMIVYRYYKDVRKSKKSIDEEAMFVQDLVDFENLRKCVSTAKENDQHSMSSESHGSTINSDALQQWFGESVHDDSEIDLSISWAPSLFEDKEESSSESSESLEHSEEKISEDSNSQQESKCQLNERNDSEWIFSRSQQNKSSSEDVSHCSFQFLDESL